MNEPEEQPSALHGIVGHVTAPEDLAERAERLARRRRTVWWIVACSVVLIAAGTGAGIAATAGSGTGASAPEYTSGMKLPGCDPQVGSYKLGAVFQAGQGFANGGPLVPGTPVAAVICRYAGFDEPQPQGDLAARAELTGSSRLAPLLAALDESRFNAPDDMGCPADNLDTAVLEFIYANKAPDVDVYYDMGCRTFRAAAGQYIARVDVRPYIEQWTGNWSTTASRSAD
jgi:hypothetical protein